MESVGGDRAISREEVAVRMTLAERARKRAELMKREEPLLAELRPFVRGNMLRHPFVIAHLDPGHAGLVNARFRAVSWEVEDAGP
jgi:hypothetical protein